MPIGTVWDDDTWDDDTFEDPTWADAEAVVDLHVQEGPVTFAHYTSGRPMTRTDTSGRPTITQLEASE